MTHQLPLAACVAATNGPILEMGAGYHSTPLLHGLCLPAERELLTLDTNAAWASQFYELRSDWHRIPAISSYDDVPLEANRWEVALIDHAPEQRRAVDILRLRSCARLLVVHDTEAPQYNYEPVLSEFRYRLDFKLWKVWTTVVSECDDLSTLAPLAMIRDRS